MTTPTNEEVRRQFDPSEAIMRVQQACASADKIAYDKGYQAALSSPAVVALVEAAKELRVSADALNGTRERLERYWSAKEQVDAAIAPFTTGAGHVE